MRAAPLTTLLALLASAAPSAAPDPDAGVARGLVERLEAHHARTTDLVARFTQSYRSGMLGREVVERGVLSVKRPGRMRWEYKDPEEKLFVSDGKTFYFYVPADRQVVVSAQDEERSLAARLLSGRGGLLDEFEASLDEPLEAGVFRLRLVPRRPQADVERAILDVEPSGRIRSILLEDVQGNRTRFRFESVRENTGLRRRALPLRRPRRGRGDPRMRRLLLPLLLAGRRRVRHLRGLPGRRERRAPPGLRPRGARVPEGGQGRARQRAVPPRPRAGPAARLHRPHQHGPAPRPGAGSTTRPSTSTASPSSSSRTPPASPRRCATSRPAVRRGPASLQEAKVAGPRARPPRPRPGAGRAAAARPRLPRGEPARGLPRPRPRRRDQRHLRPVLPGRDGVASTSRTSASTRRSTRSTRPGGPSTGWSTRRC